MDIRGRKAVIFGGSGLVGGAIARRLLPLEPALLVVGGLRREEARQAVRELQALPAAEGIEIVPEWGDIFLREEHAGRPYPELLQDAGSRAELLDDIFGPLDEGAFGRSTLVRTLERHRPDIVIDCVNTATAIAYRDLFASAAELRRTLAEEGTVSAAALEAHLTMLYLPRLIRHAQLILEGLRRAGTLAYVKVGTSGTGGMGLNVPFTHSEERPSRTLLAKAGLAGAHSLLLFLMGRTPGAPAIAEVKPAAAIAWKRIAFGPVVQRGRPMARWDSERPVQLEEAFDSAREPTWSDTGEVLESVFLDAGENGLFSLGEFEAISALGMMELVTPEEIAQAVIDEVRGRPTGRDVVAALDASAFGPTYRGGMMREAALLRMEALERAHGVRSVAFEMLGPPRLSKLLFEASILERLYSDMDEAAELDPDRTAERALELVNGDARLRSDILSVGIPILLPDGKCLLRGPEVKIAPPPVGTGRDGERAADRWAAHGWVDLRPGSWVQWRERCERFREAHPRAPGADAGSDSDLDLRASSGEIRPGALAAFVFRVEDGGGRIKR